MPDITFWQERYDNEHTPWDLGGPSPHFVRFLEEFGENLPRGTMAILGAGRGHDAALFADAGFQVTGFDYAPGAVSEAKRLYGDKADFHQADIFQLSPEWNQSFDYVLEHTCFCAISPKLRSDYRDAVSRILKPEGRLIGIFWEHAEPDGPPYSTPLQELQNVFNSGFNLEKTEDNRPAGSRSGIERLIVFSKKPG